MSVRLGIPSKRAVRFIRNKTTSQMFDQVEITRPGPATFNAATGMITAHTGSEIYSGVARVWQGRGNPSVLGEGTISFETTTVSLPWDGTPAIKRDDLVRVTVSPDRQIVGRVWRVLDVAVGGALGASRDLTCVEVEPSAYST